MFLRDSNAIRTAIHDLVAGHTEDEPIGLAVAFWGAGAEGMLPAGGRYQVICNLSMGGTNPKVIAQLMERSDVEVRHLPDLHAKVVVAAGGSVVSSANFSANGLGLEGVTSSGWQEAGVFIPAADAEFVQVYGWFAQHWRAASPVTAEVLEEAEKQWQTRTVERPAFEISPENGPLSEQSRACPELAESDLFQPRIEPPKKMRSAATWMVKEYEVFLGRQLKPDEHKVPIYAAHVLWTFSGKKMATEIEEMHEICEPDQVFHRAKKKKSERTRDLIVHFAESLEVPGNVRYWARLCRDELPGFEGKLS